jgi:hypothetical protein
MAGGVTAVAGALGGNRVTADSSSRGGEELGLHSDSTERRI